MTHLRPADETARANNSGGIADPIVAGRLAGPVFIVARAMLAYLFIVEGAGKIGDYAGVVGYMQANGVDGRLLPLVILTELGGGVCILTGASTRLAAIALSGFCLLTALLFHRSADQAIEFQKNVAIAGGFLTLAVVGPGPWSLDAWRRLRRP